MKANIDDYDYIHENMADVEGFISDPLDQESKDQQEEERALILYSSVEFQNNVDLLRAVER